MIGLCVWGSGGSILHSGSKASVHNNGSGKAKPPKYSKTIAPVIDVFPDLLGVPYTWDTIKNKMEFLAGLGFKRVYLVTTPPGYPTFSNPWLDLFVPQNASGNNAVESILAVGDPTFEHIYQAHKTGMEVIAIIKPYEGGGGYTIPHGKRNFIDSRALPCLGGERQGFDAFVREHSELRVKRKPIENYDKLISQTIHTLILTFCLDEVVEGIAFNRVRLYGEKGDGSIEQHPLKGIRLWVSRDNGAYELLEQKYRISERLVCKKLFDANGAPLFEKPRRCRQVEITGLGIPPDFSYFALTLDLADGHRVMIPFSMITAHGENGQVPLTITQQVRSRSPSALNNGWNAQDLFWERFEPTYPRTYENAEDAIKQFVNYGFEFDWYGTGHWGSGWGDIPYYGMARGKMKYMKGTLCEAYPAVREYWLEQIKKLVAMGVDGVDIRLQNHSSMVSDYFHYGYNEPLVEEYERAYGTDILKEEADPLKLMKIRGLFFERFVAEAARFLHANKKKLLLHLRNCLEEPALSSIYEELGFWAMPKVLPDWETLIVLADEITVKDYNFGAYRSTRTTKIKDRARQLGKPLWIHCYIAQGGDLTTEFFDAVEKDDRVTGVLLYEMGHNPYASNPWIGLIETLSHGKIAVNEEILEKIKKIL